MATKRFKAWRVRVAGFNSLHGRRYRIEAKVVDRRATVVLGGFFGFRTKILAHAWVAENIERVRTLRPSA